MKWIVFNQIKIVQDMLIRIYRLFSKREDLGFGLSPDLVQLSALRSNLGRVLKLAGRLDFVGAEPPQNQILKQTLVQLIVCLGLIVGFWLSNAALAIAQTNFPVSSQESYQVGSQASLFNLQSSDSISVRRLQTQLNQLGYYQGAIDGIYGAETQKAVATQAATLQIAQPPQRSVMPPDIQRIRSRGTLKVAILNQENSPFFMTDPAQKFTGLDVKLAEDLAEQLGVKVEFNRSAKTFDEVAKMVYDLKADLAISKLSRTLNRAQTVRFSQPYLKMRQGLLVNRLQIAQQTEGRNMTEVIRNLQGKIGVIRGSSYVGFTQKKFPQATIVEFPTWDDAVKAVIRGDVLATYRDELEVKKIVLSQPNTALTLQTIALSDTQDAIAVALPWDSQQLLAYVNQYLDMTNINYTADSLLQEYPVATTPAEISSQENL
jgi:polar amino acid transport system substrate-binding protein